MREVEIKIAEQIDWKKKKQSKVNVNVLRRNARPLSWLENQQLSARDQILSQDLSPPTRDEQ